MKQYNNATMNEGFTLMEIVVATTIFAIVTASLMALFNYALKINRRTEALRQATQGMRNFTEFLVKEVRNGKVNYFIAGGVPSTDLGPCRLSAAGASTYNSRDNRLGVINAAGDEECFYLAYGPGNTDGKQVGDQLASNTVYTKTTSNPNPVLALQKRSMSAPENLNPPNFRIENLAFAVRPTCDPWSNCTDYSNSKPAIQPFVNITITFVASLPTGEKITIPYQTTVSTNDYSVPGN